MHGSVRLPVARHYATDSGPVTVTDNVPGKRSVRLFATEEAWAFAGQVERLRKLADHPGDDPDLVMWARFLNASNQTLLRRLLDIDGERLQIMDANSVDLQVLSLTAPGVQMFDADTATAMASETNDRIAEAIRRHPGRFAGMASFAPQDPQRAAKEIDRAIHKLKLNALIVNSHTNGEYLDDRKYWPIFEAAVAAKVPLYIHPRNLPAPAARYLTGETYTLNGAFWGFQVETGVHALRLIMSGVFEQFPDLRIILGHMGEGIPYWFYRIDYFYASRSKIKRKPSEYFKENFYITTSGVNDHAVLEYCHRVLGPDRIMWAIDYPYQETTEAVAFMRNAPLPEGDVEKIASGNAERIFRIASAQAVP
jgi:5-carboxyvanillate decarboxylase